MNAKIVAIIVLLVFLVVFAIQNTQPVTIRLLFWELTTSAVLSILVSFLGGFLVGFLIMWITPAKKKDLPFSLPKTPKPAAPTQ